LNDQLILVIDGRWLATGASHGVSPARTQLSMVSVSVLLRRRRPQSRPSKLARKAAIILVWGADRRLVPCGSPAQVRLEHSASHCGDRRRGIVLSLAFIRTKNILCLPRRPSPQRLRSRPAIRVHCGIVDLDSTQRGVIADQEAAAAGIPRKRSMRTPTRARSGSCERLESRSARLATGNAVACRRRSTEPFAAVREIRPPQTDPESPEGWSISAWTSRE
jgi:hypothetical protein